MKLSLFLLATTSSIASANVVSLNDSNFNEVTSGKPLVFIKFFAPWCGHCKAMATDWVELGKSMVDEKPDLLVAEVDCTADDSETICEDNGIQGFPTLMYGDPDFLETYEGSREYEEMYSFATTQLKGSCSPNNLDNCTDEEKAKLDTIMAMSIEDLTKEVEAFDEMLENSEEEFEDSTQVLEDEYMNMMEDNKTTKESAKLETNYDLLKAVQSLKAQQASGSDEL